MLLAGRQAIITGSSSGIGRSCAIRFAQEGADVCINYYSEKEAKDAQEGKRYREGDLPPERRLALGHGADGVRRARRAGDERRRPSRVVRAAGGAGAWGR